MKTLASFTSAELARVSAYMDSPEGQVALAERQKEIKPVLQQLECVHCIPREVLEAPTTI